MQRRRMLWPLPYSLSPLHAPSTATAISELHSAVALCLKISYRFQKVGMEKESSTMEAAVNSNGTSTAVDFLVLQSLDWWYCMYYYVL